MVVISERACANLTRQLLHSRKVLKAVLLSGEQHAQGALGTLFVRAMVNDVSLTADLGTLGTTMDFAARKMHNT